MTAEEFLAWPGDGEGGKYQLVDGELRAMSPATNTHGLIQSKLDRRIGNHLDVPGNRCQIYTEPAVAVRINAQVNTRVPDLGVTCAPDRAGDVGLLDPILLIEILSPGNSKDTWNNVWAYTTIPSVQEILIVSSFSVSAQLLRRQADGSWPANPATVGAGDMLRLASIAFEMPLTMAYEGTYLE